MEQNQNSEKKKDIGAMWIRDAKSGKKYVSISILINGVKTPFVAFKNEYKKEGSKEPDYRIYESEPQSKTDF